MATKRVVSNRRRTSMTRTLKVSGNARVIVLASADANVDSGITERVLAQRSRRKSSKGRLSA